jgi:excisionase family DNA binding protein
MSPPKEPYYAKPSHEAPPMAGARGRPPPRLSQLVVHRLPGIESVASQTAMDSKFASHVRDRRDRTARFSALSDRIGGASVAGFTQSEPAPLTATQPPPSCRRGDVMSDHVLGNVRTLRPDQADDFAGSAHLAPVHLEPRATRAASVASPWLSADEAAAYLRCPLSRVRKLTSTRDLPCYRDGRRVLYHRDELDGFVRDGGASCP